MKHHSNSIAGASIIVVVWLLAACSSDRLMVPNYNSPTPDDVGADPGALQFAVSGVLFAARNNLPAWISGTGRLGRESYLYTNNEPRNTTCWLNGPTQDAACGAGASMFGGYYVTGRYTHSLLQTAEASSALSASQKAAVFGFAKTIEAHEILYVIEGRGAFGAVVEIKDDPRELTPFVARDSVYAYVVGSLDEAKAQLIDGGAQFPFDLGDGFSGFGNPAGFLRFNRALAARANVLRASYGAAGCGVGGVECYRQALQNIAESFVDETDLDRGPRFVFSTAPGDVANPLSDGSSPFTVAHPSIRNDAELRSDGSRDLRYTEKVVTFSPPLGPPGAVAGIITNQDFLIFSGNTDPIPLITSEELILLRAEARWFTGDKSGAIADINTVRTSAGGLPATTLTAAATDAEFLTGLLYERRYSLLFEGHRWVDVRRFGRLQALPIDVPSSQALFDDLVVPQSECLQRVGALAGLEAPTCSG